MSSLIYVNQASVVYRGTTYGGESSTLSVGSVLELTESGTAIASNLQYLFSCDVSQLQMVFIKATINDAAATVTFSNTGDKCNWTAHGLSANDPVYFLGATGATAASGMTFGTVYYVKVATTNDFTISATPGGTAIVLTSDSTGTISAYKTMAIHTNAPTTGSPSQSIALVPNQATIWTGTGTNPLTTDIAPVTGVSAGGIYVTTPSVSWTLSFVVAFDITV